ncbi:MAG: hypothetical protein E4H13_08915 [Calditrichales bacterium]|nr:MAG: hypothetical protein E4H13_08915 [Calditrichales bacterium]
MNSRNEILSRLKKSARLGSTPKVKFWNDRLLFSDYPDQLTQQFCDRLKGLSGEIHLADSPVMAADLLIGLLKKHDASACAAHHFPLLDKLVKTTGQLASSLTFIDDKKISGIEFANYEIGLTAADYLVARTGSIFIRTLSAGGRRLSVLPPVHIVLAEEKQIVSSLDDVLREGHFETGNWSFASLISGPSRTSDIEKQLVLGAHGPKQLIVVLLRSEI